MARYNHWQNRNLYAATDTLPEDALRKDRGAFFGSIFDTLNHILWADRIWISRLAETEGPQSASLTTSIAECANWPDLQTARKEMDETILAWSDNLHPDDLKGNLTWYSGAAEREMTLAVAKVITHFFNHQTHHRGQVHAMLTAAGAKPGATDLALMPEDTE